MEFVLSQCKSRGINHLPIWIKALILNKYSLVTFFMVLVEVDMSSCNVKNDIGHLPLSGLHSVECGCLYLLVK